MSSKSSYDANFFSLIREKSLDSAAEILPHVLKLSGAASVIDLGCGEGAWLQVAGQLGVTDVFGIDGNYIDQGRLLIDQNLFQAADLSHRLAMKRRFDLGICLEVAEHLPPASAALLVESLVSLAPIILFSAAIPGQGGVQHRNEQWPSYWQSYFSAHRYEAVDCIRPLAWCNPRVAWWYAQNSIIYAASSWLAEHPQIRPEADAVRPLVHPGLLKWKLACLRTPEEMSVKELLRCLPRAALRALSRDGGGSCLGEEVRRDAVEMK